MIGAQSPLCSPQLPIELSLLEKLSPKFIITGRRPDGTVLMLPFLRFTASTVLASHFTSASFRTFC